MLAIAFLHFVALFASFHGAQLRNVPVNTTSGVIVGYREEVHQCNVFKGVPFAAPPIGTLRFADPQPAPSWPGERTAMSFKPGCMQSCQQRSAPLANGCPQVTSEDCLYLNIFSPEIESNGAAAKDGNLLPVLIWIHGGDYSEGSGGVEMFDSPQWASSQNIVLVTINYRLGVFGGIYIPDAGIPGNFQTKDQQMALKWVRDNIENFNGDPNLVTIFGQSAGGISVSVHLAVPSSWPYFQRAIVQSNPYGVLAVNADLAGSLASQIVDSVNCGSANMSTLRNCLQMVTATEMLLAQDTHFITPWPWQILQDAVQWMPVVEAHGFLPVQPLYASQNRSTFAPNTPIVIGNVLNETVGFVGSILSSPLSYGALELILLALFGQNITDAVLNLYIWDGGYDVNLTDTRLIFSQMASDYLFYCPTRYAAAGFAHNGANVSHYIYSHIPSYGPYFNGDTSNCNNAVCHAIELPQLFDNFYECRNQSSPFQCPTPTHDERLLGAEMETYWSNFASSGSPNLRDWGAAAGGPLHWPLYSAKRHSMNISTENAVVENYNGKVCDYFDSIGYDRR